jgi:hypothetical protein
LFPGAIISFADNISVNFTEGDISPFSLCVVLRDDGDGLQRPVDFTVTLESGNALSLSLSHSLIHKYSRFLILYLYVYIAPVGTADVIRDIILAIDFITIEPLENGFSAYLQFLPNNATTLCPDFTVVDDDLIESIESFQGSLHPALTEIDSTVINDTSVYIIDNDGKFLIALHSPMHMKSPY